MNLSVVDPSQDATEEVKVVGVLLAAGTSSRFGDENKLLATIEGTPIVRLAACNLVSSRVSSVITVLGHESDHVRKVLTDLPLTFVKNPDYSTGQGSSVRAGIRGIEGAVDAAIFALGDMPLVTPGAINALIDAYTAGFGRALAASYQGERGNPVLFDAEYFDELRTLTGDTGGRDVLLESSDGALVETNDPGVLTDVDTTDEYTQVKNQNR